MLVRRRKLELFLSELKREENLTFIGSKHVAQMVSGVAATVADTSTGAMLNSVMMRSLHLFSFLYP